MLPRSCRRVRSRCPDKLSNPARPRPPQRRHAHDGISRRFGLPRQAAADRGPQCQLGPRRPSRRRRSRSAYRQGCTPFSSRLINATRQHTVHRDQRQVGGSATVTDGRAGGPQDGSAPRPPVLRAAATLLPPQGAPSPESCRAVSIKRLIRCDSSRIISAGPARRLGDLGPIRQQAAFCARDGAGVCGIVGRRAQGDVRSRSADLTCSRCVRSASMARRGQQRLRGERFERCTAGS